LQLRDHQELKTVGKQANLSGRSLTESLEPKCSDPPLRAGAISVSGKQRKSVLSGSTKVIFQHSAAT
jgi:hypothetical protein